MSIRYEEEAPVEVQLTSLLDCVFLLLIFFLVSSQLKKIEKEIPLDLPEAVAAVDVKTEPDLTKVSVDAEGGIYVNGTKVGPGGLLRELQDAKANKPDRRVRIDGDVLAPFRYIVQVLDACTAEGFDVVGIHTATNVDKK